MQESITPGPYPEAALRELVRHIHDPVIIAAVEKSPLMAAALADYIKAVLAVHGTSADPPVAPVPQPPPIAAESARLPFPTRKALRSPCPFRHTPPGLTAPGGGKHGKHRSRAFVFARSAGRRPL